MKSFKEYLTEAKTGNVSSKLKASIEKNALKIISAIESSSNVSDALRRIAKVLKVNIKSVNDPRTGEELQVVFAGENFYTSESLLDQIEKIANNASF